MKFFNLLQVLVVLGLVIDCSYCLYEDQVGKFDWRQQYVGEVKFADFDHSSQSGKRIILGSYQNALASINARNGELGWRQIFTDDTNGEIDDLIQHSTYLLASVGRGQLVRNFNPTTGTLNWETVISDQPASFSATLGIFGSDEDAVAVLTPNKLVVLDLQKGKERWSKTLPNSDTVNYRFMAVNDDEVTVVGVAVNSHVTVVTIRDEGVQGSQNTVPAAWFHADVKCSVVGKKQLVCVDSRSSTLQTLTLKDGKVFKATLLQDLGLNPQKVSLVNFQPDQSASGLHFGLRLGPTHTAVISLDTGTPKIIKSLSGVSAVQVVKYESSQVIITLGRSTPETMELRGYDVTTGADIPELSLSITFPIHHGNPQLLYGVSYKKKDGNTGLRMFTVSDDHSVAFFQQSGKISWAREESLASLLTVEMVDLPVSMIDAQMEDEFGGKDDVLSMFIKRFSTQLSQLKEFVIQLKNKLRTPKHHHQTFEEEEEEEDEDYLTRDEFNLHKMVVAVSRAGKVFGIDSWSGQIIWRHLLPDMVPLGSRDNQRLLLFVQRTTAHFPNLPQCVVLGKHRVTGQGMIYVFNPISGAPSEGTPFAGEVLPYNVLQVTMLNQMDDHFLHPLLLLDKELKYHVYPEASRSVAEGIAPLLFMFTSDTDTGVLKGYGIKKQNNELIAKELWTANLMKDSQTITNVVTKRQNEHVHSQGVVLGDRSVMYKYLNPNLIVVTAEGEEASQKDQKLSNFLNLYLIDAVSGAMVFHCSHKKAKGPVSLVHSENWIMYNYWNQKHRRMEFAVLELYEGTKQSNATAFSSLLPPPLPIVMRQSYIFPGHISAMAATITEKGITSKHLLIALETGGILEMPKILLDARRPIVPTQETREEGLVPYIPELPRMFEATINYNQSVYNVRKIHTAPAGLESTCLVLAYGLDLFYVKVTPSKMFDVLKEDFDYFFIGSVLSAMIAVSVITQKLAQRKAISRAWK